MTHKFYNSIICCLLLLSASSTLFAEVEFKFGVIDVERIIEEYKKSIDARSLLNSEFKRLQKQIDGMNNDILDLYEKRDKLGSLDEQLKARLNSDINIKLKEREDLVKNHQKTISDREKELFDPILKEIEELILKIGKEEKYGLIVQRRAVLYLDPKYDMTDKVLKILNEKYDKAQSEKKTKAKDEKKKVNKEDNAKPEPIIK